MNVIVILMDSLNRHYLPAYGNDWVQTPNIDRLARRSVVFDKHYIGSMPCMPARHDIWTGNLEFLWRPWGPVEPGEVTLPKILKGKVTTQLITDHYHFFMKGGETYHLDFDAWDLIRGHEVDPWVTRPNPVDIRDCREQYKKNMARMKEEKDFTSPRTFASAAQWIDDNHDQHERFLLFVDEFDPHEPFHSSEPYNSMYDSDWNEIPFFWPTYGPNQYTPAELHHLRSQYAGKLTMADQWLGKLLDRLDKYSLWENTTVILTTDHGHFFGEHEWVGKGIFPQYQTIAHIPLMISSPGVEARRCDALTTTVDLCPTILDYLETGHEAMNGCSIRPLLEKKKGAIREYALFGWFGAYLQITDGKYTYLRAPESKDNGPLYIYRMNWSTAPWWDVPLPDERMEMGRFNPKDPRLIGRILLTDQEKSRLGISIDRIKFPTRLFHVENDPAQKNDLASDLELRARYESLLARALHETGCPPETFQRLALKETQP